MLLAQPIVSHLEVAVSELKSHLNESNADLQPFADKVRSLTTALAHFEVLDAATHQRLWSVCTSLWVCIL